MKKSVFLSYPNTVNKKQDEFITALKSHLENIELAPRTLGITDYDYKVPLQTIRSLMRECNGLINISFRRYKIIEGEKMVKDGKNKNINNKWFTSPYSQIEPAMAFQLGLPILILKEKGVIQDGMLELGAMANYIPEFDLDKVSGNSFFSSDEARSVIDSWKTDVGEVYKQKGLPHKLY